VKLFQRKVVRHRNQPGDERADFQQYDPGWSGDHNKMGGSYIASVTAFRSEIGQKKFG
jgi:hypothetical protein